MSRRRPTLDEFSSELDRLLALLADDPNLKFGAVIDTKSTEQHVAVVKIHKQLAAIGNAIDAKEQSAINDGISEFAKTLVKEYDGSLSDLQSTLHQVLGENPTGSPAKAPQFSSENSPV